MSRSQVIPEPWNTKMPSIHCRILMTRIALVAVVALSCSLKFSSGESPTGESRELWNGFAPSPWQGEQVREIRFAEGARTILLAPAPADFDLARPTQLIVFATPNGNTAEQTLGCRLTPDLDWHFDIQHVAAQWRAYGKLNEARNTMLACLQADTLSWPSWKAGRVDGPATIAKFVTSLREMVPGEEVTVTLAAHSGGGSFLFGFLDAHEAVPAWVERIAFLDANYSYEPEHCKKLLGWLGAEDRNQLAVLAYDDRNIELNGKKVVSPTGGTYRATHRMLEDLRTQVAVAESTDGEFQRFTALEEQFVAWIHPNADNLILHTRLVGEMNGLLEVLTFSAPEYRTWGTLASPRAYDKWVQAQPFSAEWYVAHAPAFPPRAQGLPTGSDLVGELLDASPAEREKRIAREILSGNVPPHLRAFEPITVAMELSDNQKHTLQYRAMCDYLAVGSENDFLRIPLTPYVAQHLADMLGCVLPTRKIVDDLDDHAQVKLAPQPLTQDRESLSTYAEHHRLIEVQRGSVTQNGIISGIKKDVVITNRLLELPGRVAIFGWHQLDGDPIQPLTTIHVDWYVDYSHGIRLIDRWALLDGKPKEVTAIWSDETLCPLLSDEGPLLQSYYLPATSQEKANH